MFLPGAKFANQKIKVFPPTSTPPQKSSPKKTLFDTQRHFLVDFSSYLRFGTNFTPSLQGQGGGGGETKKEFVRAQIGGGGGGGGGVKGATSELRVEEEEEAEEQEFNFLFVLPPFWESAARGKFPLSDN